jgi:hypothetical protein
MSRALPVNEHQPTWMLFTLRSSHRACLPDQWQRVNRTFVPLTLVALLFSLPWLPTSKAKLTSWNQIPDPVTTTRPAKDAPSPLRDLTTTGLPAATARPKVRVPP